MTIVIGHSSRAEHLRMAIECARHVGRVGGEKERALAVQRIHDYEDELAWLRRTHR